MINSFKNIKKLSKDTSLTKFFGFVSIKKVHIKKFREWIYKCITTIVLIRLLLF